MTVLHIIEPFAGGVITFLVELTREMPEHRHVVLHGSRTTADRVDAIRARFEPGVEFVEWPHAQREISPMADLRAFFFLWRYLRKNRYDIVHLHSSKAGFLGRLVCFLLGIKAVVYTSHAAAFMRKDIGRFTRWTYVMLEKFSNMLTGTVVSCCRSEMLAFEQEGIKTLCINNGTSHAPIQKNRGNKPVVICSAFMTRQKNPKLFNDIASRFEGDESLEFCWVGDGDLRHRVTSPNVSITGWLPATDVLKYYERATIYLATSEWEGMPYSVLEAMNAKCALILTDCDGHRDAVEPGVNGFLFSTVNEAVGYLRRLVDDPQRVLSMGEESFKIVRDRFSAASMASSYNALYLALQHERVSKVVLQRPRQA